MSQDDYRYLPQNCKILTEYSDEDLRNAFAEKFERVEQAMRDQLNKELFSDIGGPYDYTPPTFWQRMKRLMTRPYYFIKYRIVGIWNVLLHGECDQCEQGDWY